MGRLKRNTLLTMKEDFVQDGDFVQDEDTESDASGETESSELNDDEFELPTDNNKGKNKGKNKKASQKAKEWALFAMSMIVNYMVIIIKITRQYLSILDQSHAKELFDRFGGVYESNLLVKLQNRLGKNKTVTEVMNDLCNREFDDKPKTDGPDRSLSDHKKSSKVGWPITGLACDVKTTQLIDALSNRKNMGGSWGWSTNPIPLKKNTDGNIYITPVKNRRKHEGVITENFTKHVGNNLRNKLAKDKDPRLEWKMTENEKQLAEIIAYNNRFIRWKIWRSRANIFQKYFLNHIFKYARKIIIIDKDDPDLDRRILRRLISKNGFVNCFVIEFIDWYECHLFFAIITIATMLMMLTHGVQMSQTPLLVMKKFIDQNFPFPVPEIIIGLVYIWLLLVYSVSWPLGLFGTLFSVLNVPFWGYFILKYHFKHLLCEVERRGYVRDPLLLPFVKPICNLWNFIMNQIRKLFGMKKIKDKNEFQNAKKDIKGIGSAARKAWDKIKTIIRDPLDCSNDREILKKICDLVVKLYDLIWAYTMRIVLVIIQYVLLVYAVMLKVVSIVNPITFLGWLAGRYKPSQPYIVLPTYKGLSTDELVKFLNNITKNGEISANQAALREETKTNLEAIFKPEPYPWSLPFLESGFLKYYDKYITPYWSLKMFSKWVMWLVDIITCFDYSTYKVNRKLFKKPMRAISKFLGTGNLLNFKGNPKRCHPIGWNGDVSGGDVVKEPVSFWGADDQEDSDTEKNPMGYTRPQWKQQQLHMEKADVSGGVYDLEEELEDLEMDSDYEDEVEHQQKIDEKEAALVVAKSNLAMNYPAVPRADVLGDYDSTKDGQEPWNASDEALRKYEAIKKGADDAEQDDMDAADAE